MTMTREQVAALLDGTTPGPWHYRPHKHDDWGVVRGGVFNDEWGGYPHLAQVRDPDKLDEPTLAEHRVSGNDPWEGNARLTAAAPDLARLCLSLMDRLADADVAQAALVERAAEVADANCIYPEGYYGDMPSVAIRAIAPDAGVKNLAALRAERDDLRKRVKMLSFMGEGYAFLERDRDRLAAELAEAQESVATLQRMHTDRCRELAEARAQIEALRGALEYIAGATDIEGQEPGMWAINRARNALAALPAKEVK